MLNLENSERYAYIKTYEYLSSNRKVVLARYHVSDRYIGVETYFVSECFRRAYACTESPFSVRYVHITACRFKETTSRFCVFRGAPGQNERTCYYKVGAKVVLHSATVKLLFTYADERYTWVHKDPISQRVTIFPLLVPSERHSYIARVHSIKLHTPLAFDTIILSSERNVLLQLHQNYSMRFIQFVYAINSERSCICSNYRLVAVHTPQTNFSINGLYSQRSVAFVVVSNSSERHVQFTLVPKSERMCSYAYRTYIERSVYLCVHTPYVLHSLLVVQARPEKSERKCDFRTIAYDSSRSVFLETRDIYSTKTMSLGNDVVSLMSSSDTHANITISSDRELTITGTNIILQEALNKLTSSRVTISTLGTNYSLSVVDYKGALLSTTSSNNKKTLISANIFCLNIELT